VRKGGTWLKTTLAQCAWAAVKKKDNQYELVPNLKTANALGFEYSHAARAS
jgi:hypothetical protein